MLKKIAKQIIAEWNADATWHKVIIVTAITLGIAIDIYVLAF